MQLKLVLDKREGNDFDYSILENGNQIGFLFLTVENNTIVVDNVHGIEDLETGDIVLELGPAKVRELLRLVKQEFPSATHIAGIRASGARLRSGQTFIKREL